MTPSVEHVRILTSKESRNTNGDSAQQRTGLARKPAAKKRNFDRHSTIHDARRAQSKSSLIFHFPLIFI